jgi:hypothetical protein
VDDPEPVAELALDVAQDGCSASTVRALVIAELHEGHRGRRRPERRGMRIKEFLEVLRTGIAAWTHEEPSG